MPESETVELRGGPLDGEFHAVVRGTREIIFPVMLLPGVSFVVTPDYVPIFSTMRYARRDESSDMFYEGAR